MLDTQMQRTTISLNKTLKRMAERKALEEGKTFQAVINDVLYDAFFKPNKIKKIDFKKLVQPIGTMGSLTREEIYDF